ncbi:HalOD1 output domain-containing protein [Haloarcula marina]|uniref:HalOD1 output domain-containing protein n=1 Tax=Haloarcula marina TaxID=2961574 RepID=UPI0020B6D402|nr:HalOD1 output domain-containing protein [Halomicroarcula marina]
MDNELLLLHMHRNESNGYSRGYGHVDAPQTYVVKHDFGGTAALTTTLAHAIADVTGVDVTDAGFTLYDHVDPEALDRLFKPKADGSLRVDGYFTFTIWGNQVTVHSDGRIAIVPPQQPPQNR